MNLYGWVALFIMEGLIVLEGICAHLNYFLTPRQMFLQGIRGGIPFLGHEAMIFCDPFIVSPAVALVVSNYLPGRSAFAVFLSLLAGAVLSQGMHITYKWATIPDALVQSHELTAAGQVHWVYMMIGFATAILFITGHPKPEHVRIAVFALSVHVVLATHLPLWVLAKAGMISWYPGEPLHDPMTYVIVSAAIIGSTIAVYHTR